MRIPRLLLPVLLLASSAFAQHQHDSAQPPSMADAAMSTRHMKSTPHMRMTAIGELKKGDQQRADEIVAAARRAIEPYRDYRAAERDGYRIFLPNVPQKMYHFTNYEYGFEAAFRFNPEHPTSLLYEKTADGYKLIGAMYTAPAQAAEEELDSRVPLSIARWHLHTNFCQAPRGREREYLGAHAKFGLRGSIVNAADCQREGGIFRDHVFGWMVHIYPFEKTPEEMWSVERQMEHQH